MTRRYLVRADLALGFMDGVPISSALPVNLGPFRLDHSPNAALYLADLGLIEPDQISRDNHDSEFPMSLLYLEHRYTCANDENPTRQADGALVRLERLLRLFQPGEVSVLRHGVWQNDEDGRQTPAWSISAYDFRPVKPPIEGLHEYGDYSLDDVTLRSLIEFIDRFWRVLDKTPTNIQTAMARFSSSYEKRDLADRMIDLVIALEALFGDGEPGSITYKLAMRGACWLHATKNERRAAFDTIKKLYRHRSRVVHGNSSNDLTGQRVNELEGIVRSSLRKFLDWRVQHGKTPDSRDIDDLIMAGKVWQALESSPRPCDLREKGSH